MKCAKCGYISFDYLTACKSCHAELGDIREALGFSDFPAVAPHSLLESSSAAVDSADEFGVHPEPAEEDMNLIFGDEDLFGEPQQQLELGLGDVAPDLDMGLDLSVSEDLLQFDVAEPGSLSGGTLPDASKPAASGAGPLVYEAPDSGQEDLLEFEMLEDIVEEDVVPESAGAGTVLNAGSPTAPGDSIDEIDEADLMLDEISALEFTLEEDAGAVAGGSDAGVLELPDEAELDLGDLDISDPGAGGERSEPGSPSAGTRSAPEEESWELEETLELSDDEILEAIPDLEEPDR